jgi:cell division FtsZ-interacting protein ZapD
VSFASSEDATLFYHARPVILALCDELEQAELNQRPGVIEDLQSQVQTTKNERDAARVETARLEGVVSQLLKREEMLAQVAKLGRTLQPKYVALFDKARALQSALDAARARAVLLEAEIERAGKA